MSPVFRLLISRTVKESMYVVQATVYVILWSSDQKLMQDPGKWVRSSRCVPDICSWPQTCRRLWSHSMSVWQLTLTGGSSLCARLSVC